MNVPAHVFFWVMALALTSTAAFCSQDECCKDHLIKVTGQAEIKATTDEIILSLGIENWNKDLLAAKTENDRIIDQIIGEVKATGIESKNFQTDILRINPRYKKDYEKEVFLGYLVTRRLVITIKDIGKFSTILTNSLQSGATHVHGIAL